MAGLEDFQLIRIEQAKKEFSDKEVLKPAGVTLNEVRLVRYKYKSAWILYF
jgi:hypothetical protein